MCVTSVTSTPQLFTSTQITANTTLAGATLLTKHTNRATTYTIPACDADGAKTSDTYVALVCREYHFSAVAKGDTLHVLDRGLSKDFLRALARAVVDPKATYTNNKVAHRSYALAKASLRYSLWDFGKHMRFQLFSVYNTLTTPGFCWCIGFDYNNCVRNPRKFGDPAVFTTPQNADMVIFYLFYLLYYLLFFR